MKISKEVMLAQGKQALEDKLFVDSAGLDEIERMPTLRMLGSLRFMQRLCEEKNITIHEMTAELLVNELKYSPKFALS